MALKAMMALALVAAAVTSVSAVCPITPTGTGGSGLNATILAANLTTTCYTDANACNQCLCNLTTLFLPAINSTLNGSLASASNVNLSATINPVLSDCVGTTAWNNDLVAAGANATILSQATQCTQATGTCLSGVLSALVPASPPAPAPAPAAPTNTTHTPSGAGAAGVTVMGLLSAVSLAAMLL